ncbi:MAG: adenylosuccinate synthetase, partial [Paeniglutamicibacter sp.]
TTARTLEDLPENARKYVLALEAMSGTRFSAIGVGPDREQTIVRHDLIND